MPLKQRILNVHLDLPSGPQTLSADLTMHVNIQKFALAIQGKCTIDVVNLTSAMRESILSQFNAWNVRLTQTQSDSNAASPYVPISVEAGYVNGSVTGTSTIFMGQVAHAAPTTMPPNLGVRIEAYTRLIDRTQWKSEPAPSQGTFKAFIIWAAGQMNLRPDCQTSYDNRVSPNIGASVMTMDAMLPYIQSLYQHKVVAFIDNDTLVVRDIANLISSSDVVNVDEFVGTPVWNEWGVEFQTLFDPRLKLVGAAQLNSIMNPSLNSKFVLMQIGYDLASRDTPFYVSASGSPPASAVTQF